MVKCGQSSIFDYMNRSAGKQAPLAAAGARASKREADREYDLTKRKLAFQSWSMCRRQNSCTAVCVKVNKYGHAPTSQCIHHAIKYESRSFFFFVPDNLKFWGTTQNADLVVFSNLISNAADRQGR